MNYRHGILPSCMVLLGFILQDTLCYWLDISSFTSAEKNNFNAVSIGQFYITLLEYIHNLLP